MRNTRTRRDYQRQHNLSCTLILCTSEGSKRFPFIVLDIHLSLRSNTISTNAYLLNYYQLQLQHQLILSIYPISP